MEADFPAERWYWFHPPFTKEQSVMLLKQPDNLWRLDIKLGKDASQGIVEDRQFIKDQITSVVGHRSFELDWISIYSYNSKMLERFVHGRVIFAGDAAHVFSPFGARGANGGIEDADNLSWKLAKVLKGQAEASLLETYNAERTAAARQNLASTNESNLFIAPPSKAATLFRNEILEKAANDPIAKKQINCGRLSVPCIYGKYPASEQGEWPNSDLSPGRAVRDCKMADGFFIDKLGYCFTVLTIENTLSKADIATLQLNQIKVVEVIAEKNQDMVRLYNLQKGSGYLLSPDLYVLGRWKSIKYKSIMALYQKYLSGEVPGLYEWEKSEQEIIDGEVAAKIKELSHEN
jgi:3-(3-hydroxy-phenyl)propionate hydroxylase